MIRAALLLAFSLALGHAGAQTPDQVAECDKKAPRYRDGAAEWQAYMDKCLEEVRTPEQRAAITREKAEAVAWARRPKNVTIGMTKKQVLATQWGKPDDVNTTTTKYGTREQWVYGGHNFLYFDNGVLTAIQN